MDRNTFSAGAEDILGYFYDISQLPRQSGNNEQMLLFISAHKRDMKRQFQ